MKKMLLSAALGIGLMAVPAQAVGFLFEVDPIDGSVTAPPGETAGWGYRLGNTTADWLELTGLSSDVFFGGVPSVLFDFPILAPGADINVPWSAGATGLFEFTWDRGVANGTTNSGTFSLDGVFWDGNPLLGGATQVGIADPQSQNYLVTAQSVVIPEPAPILLAIPMALLVIARKLYA